MKMKLKFRVLLAVLLTLALGTGMVAMADNSGGTVTVVHGVPGLVVDVYVNGDLTLPGFEPGAISPELSLPAGDYDIVIVPEGGDPGAPAISGSATVTDGVNASIVAHLAEDGAPTLSVFANDVSPINDGDARVIVRHVAAAPAVDAGLMEMGGEAYKLEGLTNPNEAQIELSAGDYYGAIAPAGTMTPVLGPESGSLMPNKLYIAYVYGSLADDTLNGIVQEIDLEAIPTGTVSVVHGVPGLTVDVYLNGELAIPGFEPGTIAGPLTLPAIAYDIVIVPEGGDPSQPAISGSASLPAGANVSIVAHLTESGAPTLSVFVNDMTPTAAGEARVGVRHVAAAPAVDLVLNQGSDSFAVVEDVSNSQGATVDVPAGVYSGSINPANSATPVFGPVTQNFQAGSYQIAYAYGSLADGTFDLLVQEISLP